MDFSFLDSWSPWVIWYITGLVLMVLELLTPGVMLLWFGLGALACGLITQVFGLESWMLQGVIFAVCSMISVLVGRKMVRRGTTPSGLNQRLQQYVGRTSTLEGPIVNGKGRIRLDDTYWMVLGPDLPAGTTVRVVRADNSTLFVEQA